VSPPPVLHPRFSQPLAAPVPQTVPPITDLAPAQADCGCMGSSRRSATPTVLPHPTRTPRRHRRVGSQEPVPRSRVCHRCLDLLIARFLLLQSIVRRTDYLQFRQLPRLTSRGFPRNRMHEGRQGGGGQTGTMKLAPSSTQQQSWRLRRTERLSRA